MPEHEGARKYQQPAYEAIYGQNLISDACLEYKIAITGNNFLHTDLETDKGQRKKKRNEQVTDRKSVFEKVQHRDNCKYRSICHCGNQIDVSLEQIDRQHKNSEANGKHMVNDDFFIP